VSIRFWVLMLVAVFFFGIIAGIYLTWDRGERLQSGRGKHQAGEALLPKERVDVSAERIELAQGRNQSMEWSLSAGRGEYDQQNRLVVIADPDVTYYLGRERKPVRVRGEKGSVSQETGGVRLWGGVRVDFDNFGVNATELEYFSANKTLRLDRNVTLSRAGLTANASAVAMNLDSMDVTVTGPVSALVAERYLGFHPEDGGNATEASGQPGVANATSGPGGQGEDSGGLEALDRATRLIPSGTGQGREETKAPPPARKAKRPGHKHGRTRE
jgi:LPS export ABC transporter protein LptC